MRLKCGLNNALARALNGYNAMCQILDLYNFFVVIVRLKDQDCIIEKRYSKYDLEDKETKDVIDDVMCEVERVVHSGS